MNSVTALLMSEVVLVDEKDNPVGVQEKIKAHELGSLHRAFSVFIFNMKGQLLLQKRAEGKYHSAGLWTNTCCSHPMPGEEIEKAAHRRLHEEFGFDCSLEKTFSIIYRKKLGNGLTEYEFDHVFIGRHEGPPKPCENEVKDWKWEDLGKVKNDIKNHPGKYTHWFKIIMNYHLGKLEKWLGKRE